MTIQNNSTITASDLQSMWTPVVSGIILDIDPWEEHNIVISFQDKAPGTETALFIPPTDMVIDNIYANVTTTSGTGSVTLSITGNINQEISATANYTYTPEYTTEIDLTDYLPSGVNGLLAGDTITATVTHSGAHLLNRVDFVILASSKWSRL